MELGRFWVTAMHLCVCMLCMQSSVPYVTSWYGKVLPYDNVCMYVILRFLFWDFAGSMFVL